MLSHGAPLQLNQSWLDCMKDTQSNTVRRIVLLLKLLYIAKLIVMSNATKS
jgi:hypothetical protein